MLSGTGTLAADTLGHGGLGVCSVASHGCLIGLGSEKFGGRVNALDFLTCFLNGICGPAGHIILLGGWDGVQKDPVLR